MIVAISYSVYSRSISGSVIRSRDNRAEFLHAFLAEIGTHQQLDDLRIPPEAGAVGMVGRQEDPPRIIDQQQQFQTDRPLHGVDQIAGAIRIRHDAAAGFVLDIQIAPFAAGELVEQVLPRTVGGDRDRVAKQHGTGVGRHVRMRVEVLGDFGRRRAHRVPVVAAVGVVLRMGDVGPTAFQMLHRLERGADVARCAKIVAVQMHRMRQAEFIADLRELRDDRAGRELL